MSSFNLIKFAFCEKLRTIESNNTLCILNSYLKNFINKYYTLVDLIVLIGNAILDHEGVIIRLAWKDAMVVESQLKAIWRAVLV